MRAGAAPITASARRFTVRRACARNEVSMSTNKPDMKEERDGTFGMDRREFLVTTAVVGGGMVLGFFTPSASHAASLPVIAQPWYRDATVPEINAWIAIAPDDTVTIRIGQTEIGTGGLTCNAKI